MDARELGPGCSLSYIYIYICQMSEGPAGHGESLTILKHRVDLIKNDKYQTNLGMCLQKQKRKKKT